MTALSIIIALSKQKVLAKRGPTIHVMGSSPGDASENPVM